MIHTIMLTVIAILAALTLAFLWHTRNRAHGSRAESAAHVELQLDLEKLRSREQGLVLQVEELRSRVQQADAALQEERAAGTARVERLRAELSESLVGCQAKAHEAERTVSSLCAQLEAKQEQAMELERRGAQLDALVASSQHELTSTRRALADLHAQCAGQAERLTELKKREQELSELRQALDGVQRELRAKGERVVTLEVELEQERKMSAEKLALHAELQAALEERFKGVAAQVLESNTAKFETHTKQRLTEMAQGLATHVKELAHKVDQTHMDDGKARAALQVELKAVIDATRRIDEDAANLTRALTGDRRAQGAWGELVLESILQKCGLREGEEYVRQPVLESDEEQRLRPDVIVRLPGHRTVIIDAKVSLTAYTEHVAGDESALARHATSVRSHVKRLAEKEYWKLNGLRAGDYVLMFLPIESALSAALAADPKLFEFAFDHHVILISPTTLLATLRTIEHTWHVERQNDTARKIVEQAGKLYDKFCGFAAELDKVGRALKHAQAAYDDAHGKLSHGRGNLFGHMEKLRTFGLKVKKPLCPELTAGSDDDASLDPESEAVETNVAGGADGIESGVVALPA